MKLKLSQFSLLILLILPSLILCHCADKEEEHDNDVSDKQSVLQEGEKNILTLDEKTQQLIGLSTIETNRAPVAAIVWFNGNAWYYVQRDSTHFFREKISENLLPSPQKIVVIGAQTLLSEEFRDEIGVE